MLFRNLMPLSLRPSVAKQYFPFSWFLLTRSKKPSKIKKFDIRALPIFLTIFHIRRSCIWVSNMWLSSLILNWASRIRHSWLLRFAIYAHSLPLYPRHPALPVLNIAPLSLSQWLTFIHGPRPKGSRNRPWSRWTEIASVRNGPNWTTGRKKRFCLSRQSMKCWRH